MALTTTKMGLASWNSIEDDYDYQQLANNWQLVDFHDHTPGRGVPIGAGGLGVGSVLEQNISAGIVDTTHLSSRLLNDLGLGVGNRGSVINPNIFTVSTTTLSVTDQVDNINVVAGSLVSITYQSLWEVSSASGTGTAQLVVSSNNGTSWSGLPVAQVNGAPAATAAQASTTAVYLSPLSSGPNGLVTAASTTANSSQSSLGQIVSAGSGSGETLVFFDTGGTYSFGVGFAISASAYNVSVSNRHLWVRTLAFE